MTCFESIFFQSKQENVRIESNAMNFFGLKFLKVFRDFLSFLFTCFLDTESLFFVATGRV